MARRRSLQETPLYRAAIEDEADEVRRLAAKGAALDDTDAQGRTALYGAVHAGALAAVTALLDLGADPDAHDAALLPTAWKQPLQPDATARGTLLHLAAAADRAELVRLLASRGFAIDAPDRDGVTPLGLAASVAARAAAEALLALGADPNAADVEGHVPLDLAGGALVGLLLDRGARPEGAPERAETPLGRFAVLGDTGAVELLLAAGANPDRPHGAHRPLAWAARHGHMGVLERLLEAGAAADGTVGAPAGEARRTALELAASAGHEAAVDRLLAAGARALTPSLFAATGAGHSRVVRKLLDAGAELGAVDPATGHTVLHVAAAARQAEVVVLLLAAGVARDVRDPEGRTPLMLAASAGDEKSCRALVQAGASLTASAHDGTTPAKAAERAGHPQLAWSLRPVFRPVPRPAPEKKPRAVPPRPAPEGGPFPIGGRVEHPTFGRGTVRAVAGAGDDCKVTVAFERVGTKQLLARFVTPL